MTRRCAESIDVERRAEIPARFRWRGRVYPVQAVLAHWVEAGGWWRLLGAGAPLTDREREFWRVEAGSAGRRGVYDLCFDWSAGAWSIARIHD